MNQNPKEQQGKLEFFAGGSVGSTLKRIEDAAGSLNTKEIGVRSFPSFLAVFRQFPLGPKS